MAPRLQSLEEKLERYTRKGPGCWLWRGAVGGSGYGSINHGYSSLKAHRVAWQVANGRPVPEGMSVLHSCDRPTCVNPAHLFLGTHRDNMRDMGDKGRAAVQRPDGPRARGELNGNARLNPRAVRMIRSIPAARWGELDRRALAEKFGVTESAIKHVRAGHTWRHVV